jgi:cholesterol transport system auxiliary component
MRRSLVVLTLLLQVACAGGLRSNAPAVQSYTLRAAQSPQALSAARSGRASLRVLLPLAAPGMHSEHIVIMQPDHRMSYYAGSQWAAELPRVVEGLAVERLRATGDWAAVSNSESAFPSEYFLQITIRRFEAEYTSDVAPTARVDFDCALGRSADHALIAGFTAQAAATASANRMSLVIAAFEEAANKALSDLAASSAAAVRSSQAPSSP